MSRFRRFSSRPRASIDPLSAAAITAGAMLLAALGIYFARPAQHAPRAADDIAAGPSSTVPNLVTAGILPGIPSTTTTASALTGVLPQTGGPLPPTTVRPAAPTTTTTTSSAARFTAPPGTSPQPTTTVPPPPTSESTTTTSAPPDTSTTKPPPTPPTTPSTLPTIPFPLSSQ